MTKRVYVCMDDDGDHVVCPLEDMEPYSVGGTWVQRDDSGYRMDCRLPEIIFLDLFGPLNLKPGDGPELVDITVTIARR